MFTRVGGREEQRGSEEAGVSSGSGRGAPRPHALALAGSWDPDVTGADDALPTL